MNTQSHLDSQNSMVSADGFKEKRTEYVYKEYVRLAEKCEEHTKSIIDNFKLLGSIGTFGTIIISLIGVLLSDKINSLLNGSNINYESLVWIGFLVLFLITITILFRNSFQTSLVMYIIQCLKHYENQLRIEISGQGDQETPESILNMNEEKLSLIYYRNINQLLRKLRTLYRSFVVVFFLFTILIPCMILWILDWKYGFSYLVLTGLIVIFFIWSDSRDRV